MKWLSISQLQSATWRAAATNWCGFSISFHWRRDCSLAMFTKITWNYEWSIKSKRRSRMFLNDASKTAQRDGEKVKWNSKWKMNVFSLIDTKTKKNSFDIVWFLFIMLLSPLHIMWQYFFRSLQFFFCLFLWFAKLTPVAHCRSGDCVFCYVNYCKSVDSLLFKCVTTRVVCCPVRNYWNNVLARVFCLCRRQLLFAQIKTLRSFVALIFKWSLMHWWEAKISRLCTMSVFEV